MTSMSFFLAPSKSGPAEKTVPLLGPLREATDYNDSEVKCRSKINLTAMSPNASSSDGDLSSQNEGRTSDSSKSSSHSATIHLSGNLTQDEIQESMDSLKQKLDVLKSMVESDNRLSPNKKTPTFIDEHILSVIFGLALVAILSVTIYAFQALYVAATKKRT